MKCESQEEFKGEHGSPTNNSGCSTAVQPAWDDHDLQVRDRVNSVSEKANVASSLQQTLRHWQLGTPSTEHSNKSQSSNKLYPQSRHEDGMLKHSVCMRHAMERFETVLSRAPKARVW